MLPLPCPNRMNSRSNISRALGRFRPRACSSRSTMKLFSLCLTALVLACGLTLSNVGAAGTESHGGGTEKTPPTGAAWFMGRANTIKTCVVLAPGFLVRDSFEGAAHELTQREARDAISGAFATWKNYLDERGLNEPTSWGYASPYPGYTDPFMGYATNLAFTDRCDDTADLRVYFGTIDDKVAQVKKSYLNPYGIAGTIDAGANPLWRKGLIWLAAPLSVDGYTPNWVPKNLRAILTHEVGHAFGNGHVPGTIMSADIGNLYTGASSLPDYADHIDQLRALYRGSETHRMKLAADPDHFQYRLGFSFTRLMGRAPLGQIIETLEVSQPAKSLTESGTLTLADGKDSKTFAISYRTPLPCSTVGDGIFWTPLASGSQIGTASVSCMMVGELRASDGKTYPVAVERDGDWRYDITLSDVDDIYKNELFVWTPAQPGNEESTTRK
jgi:hypothetical protein